MPGPEYRVLCADLLSGTIKESIPFDTFTYGHALDAAGSISASIDVRSPKAKRENLDPSRTSIFVLRDGVCVWSGIMWTALADIGQQNQLQVGGEGYWSYFLGPGGNTGRGRFLKADQVYTSVDQLFVAQDLINWAQQQPGGDIGIVVGDETSGVLTSQAYGSLTRPNIGTLIQTLASLPGGFDYSIDTDVSSGTPISSLHLWYPMQGRRDTGIVFRLGGRSITSLQQSIDGTEQANSVDFIGTGVDGLTPIASSQDTSVLDSYPLLETVQQGSQTDTSLDDLQSEADSYLAAVDGPVLSLPGFTANVTKDFAPGDYSMGDWVTVVAHDGYLDFEDTFRIVGDSIAVDANGSEQVTLTFAAAGTFV